MKAAILVPVGNAKIRDPKTKNYLLDDGEMKPLIGIEGRYWRRRIKNGCVMIKPKASIKKVKTENKEKLS